MLIQSVPHQLFGFLAPFDICFLLCLTVGLSLLVHLWNLLVDSAPCLMQLPFCLKYSYSNVNNCIFHNLLSCWFSSHFICSLQRNQCRSADILNACSFLSKAFDPAPWKQDTALVTLDSILALLENIVFRHRSQIRQFKLSFAFWAKPCWHLSRSTGEVNLLEGILCASAVFFWEKPEALLRVDHANAPSISHKQGTRSSKEWWAKILSVILLEALVFLWSWLVLAQQ